MKQRFRPFLSILLVLMLLIASTAPAFATGPSRYVSLGDSIATGTTTPLTAPTKPYTDQLFDYLLQYKDPAFTRTEFETDGDRTNELLSKLSTNGAMIGAVTNATVITVSIGGNNLMQACKTWYGYNFFKPNKTVSDKGYADFKTQWPQIMSRIRVLNPTATLLVLNLYNPFNTADATMHTFVDGYYVRKDGTGMNQLIGKYASTNNYKVADAFTAYDAYCNGRMGTVTLMYPASLLRNPHPTQSGQTMLFNLHKSLLP